MDLVDPLEIGGDGLQLHSQTSIAGDREAILPHHGDESASIVLEDLKTKNKEEKNICERDHDSETN